MKQIMDALRASDEPAADQRTLMKAALIYWLLAATDAHAKNYSIALLPEGRFKLAPLYDVISVQPLFDKGQLRRNQMKLSMAFGNSRHYRMDKLSVRHFAETAKASGLPANLINELGTELLTDSEDALIATASAMPAEFPQELIASIFDGYNARLGQLERWVQNNDD